MEERQVPLRHLVARWVAPVAVVVVLVTVLVVVRSVSSSSGAGVTRVTGTVDLGRATTVNNEQVVTQGPNGDVYVGYGTAVKVVRGTAAPVLLLHAPREVLAIAATSSSLYVETKTAIQEYSLPGAAYLGTWNLPGGIAPAPITAAGMSVTSSRLWTWTDWSTDASGYEYASISSFSLPGWTSSVLANNSAAPTDVALGSGGYYFLAHDRFVRATPGGSLVRSPVTADASEAPVGVWNTTAWLVATREPSGANYLDTYNATTMARVRSVHLAHQTWGVLGTSTGPWAIEDVTAPNNTSKQLVVSLNDTTGFASSIVSVPGAFQLLPGPKVAVLASRSGHLYVVRLS